MSTYKNHITTIGLISRGQAHIMKNIIFRTYGNGYGYGPQQGPPYGYPQNGYNYGYNPQLPTNYAQGNWHT